ncbi:MAG: hypothetical protein WCL70_04490 [Paludibacter sp.]
MKKPQKKSIFLIVGISLILIAVLSKRLFIKNFSMESTYSFLAGFAIVMVGFIIYKVYLKYRK